MNGNKIKKLLLDAKVPSEAIATNVDMSKYSSFKVGGNAECLINIETMQILQSVCHIIRENALPFFILGSGTNIIFKDEGYKGIVIKLCGEFNACGICSDTNAKNPQLNAYSKDNTFTNPNFTIYSSASTSLRNICNLALENSLSGLEFAVGIPGSCGGAVYMNAGAYGGEMKDIITSVNALNMDTLMIETFRNDELDFSYRNSTFVENKKYIILSAIFSLQKGELDQIKSKMDSLMAMRNAKQPVKYPSVGSFFKRPPGNYAAKLIEESGLKGKIIGGVQVSELHSGFLINIGGATYTDVIEMREHVIKVVNDKFGVQLETEVEFI